VLGNWVLCWCDDRTLRAIEQDGLLLSVQILDNQPFAVRDHVDVVLHDVVHRALNHRTRHADRIGRTHARVGFIDPVPQDNDPHFVGDSLLNPPGDRSHVVCAQVVLGRHAVQKQRELVELL